MELTDSYGNEIEEGDVVETIYPKHYLGHASRFGHCVRNSKGQLEIRDGNNNTGTMGTTIRKVGDSLKITEDLFNLLLAWDKSLDHCCIREEAEGLIKEYL